MAFQLFPPAAVPMGHHRGLPLPGHGAGFPGGVPLGHAGAFLGGGHRGGGHPGNFAAGFQAGLLAAGRLKVAVKKVASPLWPKDNCYYGKHCTGQHTKCARKHPGQPGWTRGACMYGDTCWRHRAAPGSCPYLHP